MKRRKGRKLFSLLLTAALVLSLSGIMAFATESNKQAGNEVCEDEAEQSLSFKSSKVSKTTKDAPFTNQLSGVVGKVTYTSSKKSVATVDQNGKVTIVGAGKATITATDDGNAGTASFTLTVSNPTDAGTSSVSKAADVDTTEADEDKEGVGEADKVGENGEVVENEDSEAEGDEDGEVVENDDNETVGDEDGEVVEDEDGEIVEDEDGEAVGDEDGEAVEDEDGEAAGDEDGEAVEDEDGEAVEDEDGEAVEDEDGEAAGDEDGEAVEDEDGEAVEDEDGDEADSLIMEEPLVAEMTGMTVSFYSSAAVNTAEEELSFEAGSTVNKKVSDDPFINPLNGAEGEVEYSSSDESVASVDGKGMVTIKDAGNAIITAEDDSGRTASYMTVVSDDTESAGDSESTVDSQTKSDNMNIMVAISWEGDTESMRPDYVEVTLLADGKESGTMKLTASGDWRYTWMNLPVYSGDNKIEYTVKEKNVPSGYTPGYGDWFNEENDTYSIIITDTWGVESDPGIVNGPKTADINFWVLYMYLAVLSGAAIITLGVCRRTSRR